MLFAELLHTCFQLELKSHGSSALFLRAFLGFGESWRRGVEHYQYRVGKASLRDIQVLVTDRSGNELELGKEYLDKQLAFGFAEILYRDGKPYGIETEKEVTVKIVGQAPTPAADPS
jgi:hypothetical protein